MVFIVEGMSVRIPEGGLSVSFDDSGRPDFSLTALQVVYEIWPHWLEIALDHAQHAKEARQSLRGVESDDGNEKARLLIEECKAAMVGITSSVIGLDAFFAGVSERVPSYPDLRLKWASQKKKPSRASQVSQVFHRAFHYDPGVYPRVVESLRELYKIRDVAVHPSAGFQAPVQHGILGVGVEWRFATFTGTNAVKAASLSCDIIHHSVGVPRTSLPELGEWCEIARKKVEVVHGKAALLAAAVTEEESDTNAL